MDMTETTNTYWEGNGTQQEGLTRLESHTPCWGMTDNQYMNLFITASNVYYDVYNNGGCNLKECFPERIETYLLPFANELKSLRLNVKIETLVRNFKNKDKLERFMDEIVLYLQDKDLTYDKQTIYFDNNKKEVSRTEIEGFNVITFGIRQECEDWVNHRMDNWKFKMVG